MIGTNLIKMIIGRDTHETVGAMRIEKEWEKMRRARVERVKNGKKGAMSKKRSNLSDDIKPCI